MNTYLEWFVAASIFVGGAFILVGSLGLLKLPDLMSRLHGPSKATTLGVGGCLIASMFFFWSQRQQLSIQELLITLFLFITAPVTAHFISKAHMHLHPELAQSLPRSSGEGEWATYRQDLPEATSGRANSAETASVERL